MNFDFILQNMKYKRNIFFFVSKTDAGTNLLAVLTVEKCLQQTLTPFPSAKQ